MEGSTRKKKIIKMIIEYGMLIAVIFIIFHFVIGFSPVNGNSMYPTLKHGEITFYTRMHRTYQRGDIVIVKRPNGKLYVKRVVAVAGDTVKIKNNGLYVNDKKQPGDSLYAEKTQAMKGEVEYPLTIREGEYFVLGDNRENSEDSRVFGAVSKGDIKGKVLYHAGRLN